MPTVPLSIEPNHGLNFKVPELTHDQAVAASYMQHAFAEVKGMIRTSFLYSDKCC